MNRIMKNANRIGAMAAALTVAVATASAQTTRHDPVIYTFGDSLSDSGNLEGVLPDDTLSDYYRGVFSNGPVWTDIISRHQALYPGLEELQVTESTNGINLAHAGARSGRRFVNSPANYSFLAQVSAFEELIDDQTVQLQTGDIFTVWVGANDYLIDSGRPSDPEIVVANIDEGLWRLIDLGAETIVVGNLPDLSLTPLAKNSGVEEQEVYRELSVEHNGRLDFVIAQIKLLTDVKVIFFDVETILDEIVADPSRFGFSNVDEACLDTGKILDACPDDQLFYDGVHPTYAAHAFFAELVLEALEEEGL